MIDTPPYNIRKIHQTDKNDWTGMWYQYLAFYKTDLNNEIAEHSFNKLLINNDQMGSLLACNEEDIPIGFLNYIAHPSTWSLKAICYLNDLFVCAPYRKMGIASLLINYLRELSKQFNWGEIYWLTKPDNTSARAFYEKIARGETWVQYVMPL